MTGPEHYREAERLLETTSQEDHARHHRMRVAQVHATLALAAATALSDYAARWRAMPDCDAAAWLAAASDHEAAPGELGEDEHAHRSALDAG